MAKKKTKNKAEKSGKSVKKSEKSVKKQKPERTLLIIAIGIIVIIVLAAIYVSTSNNFTYLGIEFEKERYGEIIVYVANIPIVNQNNDIVNYIKLDFRNDPRKLRNIPVETNNNVIGFIPNRGAYITIDPLTEECEDSGVAIVTLGGVFLRNAGIVAKLGSMDIAHAKRENIPYITCEANSELNTVIIVKPGEENKITQPSENCYEIMYKDCDVIKVTERFSLKVIGQHVSSID